MKCEVPIWQKSNLTLEEAAAYFNIGVNKLRELSDSSQFDGCILWSGKRRLIRRDKFERKLDELFEI